MFIITTKKRFNAAVAKKVAEILTDLAKPNASAPKMKNSDLQHGDVVRAVRATVTETPIAAKRIAKAVRVKHPSVNYQAVNGALRDMTNRGEIERIARGVYKKTPLR